MIPYIEIPSLGPLKPFGMLVATGILVGNWFALRRAKQAHIDVDLVRSAVAWAVVVGFVGAHLVALIYYKPDRIIDEGPLVLLKIWDGISSFGGFMGALVGLFVFFGKGSRPTGLQVVILASPLVAGALTAANELAGQIAFGATVLAIFIYYWRPDRPWGGVAEIIVQALVVGWIFGRMGCTVAFDHPGVVSHFFLAETYHEGGESRLNLGMLEMLFTLLVLLPVQLLIWRRNPPKGLIMGVVCSLYAIVRFLLDGLRATDLTGADVRVLTMTPAQYAAIALFLFGLVQVYRVLVKARDASYPHVHDLSADFPAPAPASSSSKSGAPSKRPGRARH